MFKFSFENSTKIHFGADQIKKLALEIPADAKVLLVYGGGSIKKNGIYQQVIESLQGIEVIEFSGIKPNPEYDQLMQAVTLAKSKNINYILAVGGGSVIDGCKFIAAACCYKGDDPWNILSHQEAISESLDLGVVLTLPATGSESNTGSVITRNHHKLAFMSPLVRPKFAILDPQTTLSLNSRQISNGVVDAFVHIIEQYLTYPINAKVQDRFAEGLLLTLIEEGPKALTEPENLDTRANIMWAASLALNGLIGVGVPQDWSTHMIGHEITGLYAVDHARSLSMILPAVLKFMKTQKRDKLIQYAARVWDIHEGTEDERIDSAINNTEQFFKSMQMPIRMSEVELAKTHVDEILEKLQQHNMLSLGEKRNIHLEESQKILNLAL